MRCKGDTYYKMVDAKFKTERANKKNRKNKRVFRKMEERLRKMNGKIKAMRKAMDCIEKLFCPPHDMFPSRIAVSVENAIFLNYRDDLTETDLNIEYYFDGSAAGLVNRDRKIMFSSKISDDAELCRLVDEFRKVKQEHNSSKKN